MNISRYRLCFACLSGLLLFTFGCGGTPSRNLPVAYVEGVVTLDGAPLTEASVLFIPKTQGSGESAGGYTDATGKYTLTSMNGDPGKGALPAEYIVTISKTVSTPIPGAKVEEGDAPPEKTEEVTPAVYRDRTKSPLAASVVQGKNSFNFELKSKP